MRGKTLALVLVAVAAVLVTAVAVGWLTDTGSGREQHFRPAAPASPQPERGQGGYLAARLLRPVQLRERPGGRRRVARLGKRTPWGLPTVLSVVRRRGQWLGVTYPRSPGDRLGWLPASGARLYRMTTVFRVDLSRRRATFSRNGRVLRRFPVAIGQTAHPTPPGRFAVTDVLRVEQRGSPYGCCAIAITGKQNILPPGWPGGDRLALHATAELSSIGRAASYGCLRTTEAHMKWLMGRVPLGTPVFVRR